MKVLKLSNEKCNTFKIKSSKIVTPKPEGAVGVIKDGSFEHVSKERQIYKILGKWYSEEWYASDAFKTYGIVTDEMAHSGKQSLKCDFRNTILMRVVDVEPNTDYVFSFYYYFKSHENSKQTPLWNYVCVTNPNSEMTACNGEWWLGDPFTWKYFDGFIDGAEKTVHDRWQRIDFEFNSKGYNKLKIGLQYSAPNHATEPIYLDDLALYKKEDIENGKANLDVIAGISVNGIKPYNQNGLSLEYLVEFDKEKMLADFDGLTIKELGVEVGFNGEEKKTLILEGSDSVVVTGIAEEKIKEPISFTPYAILSNGQKLYSYEVGSSALDVMLECINDTVIDEEFVETAETREKVSEIALNSENVVHMPIYNDKGKYGETMSAMNMGVYHLTSYMKDDAGREYTEQQATDEFDRLERIGITAVRAMWRSTWSVPLDKKFNGWDWENQDIHDIFRAAREVKKRGIDVILTCGWLIDYYALDSGHLDIWYKDHPYLHGEGEDFYGESKNLDFTGLNEHQIRIKKAARRYGEWVAQSFEAFWKNGADNVKYALVFTEPRWELYKFDTWSQDYVEMVIGLNEKLEEHGIRDKILIMGPNQAPFTTKEKDMLLLDYVLKHLPDKKMIDIYSTHTGPGLEGIDEVEHTEIPDLKFNFFDEGFRNLQNVIRDNGSDVNLFSDEFFVGEPYYKPEKRLHLAPGVVSGAIAGFKRHLRGISYWSIFDQQWVNGHSNNREFVDGVHLTGMAPPLNHNYTPHIEYYGIGLFGRYAKHLDTVIETDWKKGKTLFYAMLTDKENKVKTVVVVNNGKDSKAINLEFKNALNEKLNRHTYSGFITKPDDRGRLAGIDKSFEVENNLKDVIPSCSVVIYTTRED